MTIAWQDALDKIYKVNKQGGIILPCCLVGERIAITIPGEVQMLKLVKSANWGYCYVGKRLAGKEARIDVRR